MNSICLHSLCIDLCWLSVRLFVNSVHLFFFERWIFVEVCSIYISCTLSFPLFPLHIIRQIRAWNLESGRLFIWGENQFGQLSAGSKEVITKPSCVKEIKNLGYKVRNIAFGECFSVILTGRHLNLNFHSAYILPHLHRFIFFSFHGKYISFCTYYALNSMAQWSRKQQSFFQRQIHICDKWNIWRKISEFG